MKIIRSEKARARNTDPDTSHMAAERVDVKRNQKYVLECLTHLGAASDELLVRVYAQLGYPPQAESGIRTRRRELLDKGLVEEAGTTRNKNGNTVKVWRVVK